MADSTQQKTEAPTQKRREDARKEGQVAFSKEVPASFLLGATLLLFYFWGPYLFKDIQALFKFAFTNLDYPELNISVIQQIFFSYFNTLFKLLLPLFLVIFCVAILSSVIQVGFKITGKPLLPKLEKISPLKGLSRIFSKQALNELIKSLFKLIIMIYIGYLSYEESMQEMISMATMPTNTIIFTLFKIVGLFSFRLFLALLTLSFFDYLFQKWDLEEKLKMTKQDVKEELKQTEGDPILKAKIRQIQQNMSKARMMQDVPNSDVVISNPTHFAIALKYDREIMQAPEVVAKGADFVALRIMDIAKKSDVPVIRNPTLVRSIYPQVEIGDSIPEAFFKAIAEILAFVYKSKKKKR